MGQSLSADDIREKFLSFFEARGHRRLPSSSLVPHNDPTLLFTNAGMVQFKDVFTGREKREPPRATTSQKCVRAGGKHNDLDNVGFTARHHTFFEMLGNFSFGDYFKADAVAWAWEFVTQVLALPKEKLAVTVFNGEGGIPWDEEAFEAWAKQGVPVSRIRKLGLKDNFWAMGDTGPCGPCSEIYVYLPDGAPKADDLPGDSENWLEIWNLVFMQFERREKDGAFLKLPKPSIDTGAGLERVAAVVQGKKSNYDTDLFTPLLRQVQTLCAKPYAESSLDGASMRVMADHARATAFLLADGVQPSNEGRGYVLRRIMRRAIRHGSRLGLSEPSFHHVVDGVVSLMGKSYPELVDNKSFLLEVTRHEEESFRRTLGKGLKLMDEEMARLGASSAKVLSGETVFYLHDTHGFPWDLTEVIAKERGFGIDLPAYEARMEAQRHQGASFASGDKSVGDVYLALSGKVAPTTFTGYEGSGVTGKGKVLALVVGGKEVARAEAGQAVEVVVDSTPFYAESGGQVGDSGSAAWEGGALAVVDTQKPAGALFVHKAKVSSGALKVGDELTLTVDVGRRNAIRANHSATHLLHKALKVVLGDHVKQAGSVVGPDGLRFDYAHFGALTQDQLERVEDLVNGWVRDNAEAQTKIMALDEARAAGAVALFGEKYGDRVRVVTVHGESTELCGGTHVRRSGDIGLFKVISESSIASGVRRIQGVTGAAAFNAMRATEKELWAAAELFKSSPKDLPKRIDAAQKRIKELEKRVEQLMLQGSGAAGGPTETVREVNGVKILTQQVEPADAKVLRTLADQYRDKMKSGVIGLGGTTTDGKALILVAATKDWVERGVKAGDLVREMAREIGGSGGGKADMAQAGGSDPSRIKDALEKLYTLVKP